MPAARRRTPPPCPYSGTLHHEYAQHPLGHVLSLWTALALQRVTADRPGEQTRDRGDRHENEESPAEQRAGCFAHLVHVAAVDRRDDQRDDDPGKNTAGDDLEQDRRNEVGRRVDGPERRLAPTVPW